MKMAKVLIDKYWKGTSSVKEEKWLKARCTHQGDKTPEAIYFRYLQKKSAETLEDPEFELSILNTIQGAEVRQSRRFSWMHWRVAAAVMLLIIGSITFKVGWISDNLQPDEVISADTYQDPEKALEETKKALLFISTQLNKGSAYTAEFSKFNESQEKLKKE